MKPRESALLIAPLLAINAISIFGFATFGLHPALLARWSWAPPIFAVSYPLFAKLQILAAGGALVVALGRACGTRWLPSFAALFAISLSSELMGTTYGIPFGKYAYTDLLGPKILAHVPWLIPLSWFFMAVPSFALASRALGERSAAWARIGAASLLLLAWDLTLDPAMSFLTPFWLWASPGPYHGMPLLNLFGWFVTGLVLMVVLEALRARRWMDSLPLTFYRNFYAANLFLPVGMCLVAGLWFPLLVTAAVWGGYALVSRSAERRIATVHAAIPDAAT